MKSMVLGILLFFSVLNVALAQQTPTPRAETPQKEALAPSAETDTQSGVFSRAFRGGPIVSGVLLSLILLSIVCWGVLIGKVMYIRKIEKSSQSFIKSFWDSRSLNDLNGRLSEHPYSPVREVFRNGYAELVRGSQLREQTLRTELAISAAMENLSRTLQKSKGIERRRLENLMPFLSITASAAPFIGLFGTVWGIMGAFEGIARSGSASLAAVAPGISEALIATAFGLAAAIPAVVGYNILGGKVRGVTAHIEGFSSDFMNIVERYLVSERPRAGGASQPLTSSATLSDPI